MSNVRPSGSLRLFCALLAACSVAVAVAGCGAASHGEGAPAAEPSSLPGVDLAVDDSIGGVAAALDAAGRLHVAWLAEEAAGGNLPRRSLWVSRLDGDRWATPQQLAGEAGAPLVLVAAADGLHLLAGPRLRHRLSDDGGTTWSDTGPLVPAGRRGRVFAAATALPGGWVAAFMLHPRTPYETAERTDAHRQRLFLFDARSGATTEVAAFEASTSPPAAPALAVAGGRLHVAVGLAVERPSGRTGGVGILGRLLHLSAPLDGGSWSQPADVLAGDGLLEGDLRDLDLAAGDGGLTLAWSAYSVFTAVSETGGTWSPPFHLNPYEVMAPRGDLASGEVALSPRGGRVAWVDGRFTRSDRRWWKPLGGLPWSDDTPFWANRDLFVGRPGGRGGEERLTADLASAEHLAWAAGAEREALVWSGRRRVGRTPRAAGEPPEIFFHWSPRASSPAVAVLHNQPEE
ncbi:MAG TPA: hypothetical protein VKU40_09350 [Thermoanaerobaculia bacterium]|nr:hypothetical protein [Thermoanaerobaculia bacterium]